MVLLLLVIALLSSLSALAQHTVDLDLTLEHSIANKPWVSRGNVKFLLNLAEKKLSVKLDNPTFEITSSEDLALLQMPSSFIRLRLPAVNAQGEVVPNHYVMTSMKGCALLHNSKEVISLLTDKSGAILGIQHENGGECTTTLPLSQQLLKVVTKINAVLPKESTGGVVIPPLHDVVKEAFSHPHQQEGQEKNAPPPAQSFLVQYWYIFGPLFVLYTFMTAPAAPAPGEETKATTKRAAAKE